MKAKDIHPAMLARPRNEGTERLPCDPTEDEIWNVLTKEIQAEWSARIRFNRIVDRRFLDPVEFDVARLPSRPNQIDYE